MPLTYLQLQVPTIALQCNTKHCNELLCNTLHYYAMNYTAMLCMQSMPCSVAAWAPVIAMGCIESQYIPLHWNALDSIANQSTVLHWNAMLYIAKQYIALEFNTMHCNALHCFASNSLHHIA